MDCCASILNGDLGFQCVPSLNESFKDDIKDFPDGLRKVLRLLCKQYKILEVFQNPPIYTGGITRIESPICIRYKDYFENSEEFEMFIELRSEKIII